MKFSEMQYSRPDMEALAAATARTLEALKAAPDAAGPVSYTHLDVYQRQLMFGMEAMSAAVSVLRDVPEFSRLFLLFTDPLLGVLDVYKRQISICST